MAHTPILENSAHPGAGPARTIISEIGAFPCHLHQLRATSDALSVPLRCLPVSVRVRSLLNPGVACRCPRFGPQAGGFPPIPAHPAAVGAASGRRAAVDAPAYR